MILSTTVSDGNSSWLMTFTLHFGKRTTRVDVKARNERYGHELKMPEDEAKLLRLWPMSEWPPFVTQHFHTKPSQYRQEGLFNHG